MLVKKVLYQNAHALQVRLVVVDDHKIVHVTHVMRFTQGMFHKQVKLMQI